MEVDVAYITQTMFETDARSDRERDMALRQGYLCIVDAIERRWGISPTTAELRKLHKTGKD